MKALVKIGFFVTGLLLIAWPFGVFGSAFVFDAPSKSRADEIARYLLVFAVLLYPLYWDRARKIAHAALEEEGSLKLVVGAIVAPVVVLALPFFLVFFLNFDHGLHL